MPISVKEFDFNENLEFAYISVEINGVTPAKTDIYCKFSKTLGNDLFIKVNSAPFLFEVDLLHEIDPEASNASIGENCVKFALKKLVPALWNSCSFKGDKADIINRRKEAQDRHYLKQEQKKQEKIVQREEQKRALIQKQIQVEQKQRELVENQIQQDKKQAETEIQQWTSSFLDEIDLDEDCEDGIDMDEIMQKVQKQVKPRQAPPPRKEGIIQINFTDRGPIPTQVARESEDAKWMARIQEMKAQYKRNKAADPKKIENELLLKEKGDDFYKRGNVEAAINAYTSVLDQNPAMVSSLINRSAAFMQIGQLNESFSDCCAALELLKQEAEIKKEENAELEIYEKKLLAKLHCRKAILEMQMNESFDRSSIKSELETALNFDPLNQTIQQQLEQLL